jgi:hypothetical protein
VWERGRVWQQMIITDKQIKKLIGSEPKDFDAKMKWHEKLKELRHKSIKQLWSEFGRDALDGFTVQDIQNELKAKGLARISGKKKGVRSFCFNFSFLSYLFFFSFFLFRFLFFPFLFLLILLISLVHLFAKRSW